MTREDLARFGDVGADTLVFMGSLQPTQLLAATLWHASLPAPRQPLLVFEALDTGLVASRTAAGIAYADPASAWSGARRAGRSRDISWINRSLLLCPDDPAPDVASFSSVAAEAQANGVPLVMPGGTTLATLLGAFKRARDPLPTFEVASIVDVAMRVVEDFDGIAGRAHAAIA